MQKITSKDNPKLKAVRALVRFKKEREAASAFVIEGVRSLNALLDGTALSPYQLREVWISDAVEPELLLRFEMSGVPLLQVPHELLEQMSDCRSSQGVLGVVAYAPEPLAFRAERGNYLLLDGLTDPGNMGTLIRSAVAFGFAGVFLHGDTVELFNPKTVRATMGALPFCRVWKTGDDFFEKLEKAGYQLISTVISGGEALDEMVFGPRNVLVIGHEAHGISADMRGRASRYLSIPMETAVESLNAAVAGSICMFGMRG